MCFGYQKPLLHRKKTVSPFLGRPTVDVTQMADFNTMCVIYHMRHHYLAAAILGCVIHLTLYRAYNYFEIWATNNFILADLIFNKLARKLTL